MINKIFPKQIDNNYTGHSLAKYVFVLITIVTLVRSCIHMFAPDGGAQSIATIPLNVFSHNAAETIILIFNLWGLSQAIIGIIYVIVIWRYQKLIPLMYLLMIVEYTFRMLFMFLKPIHLTGHAPGHTGDYIMIPLAIIMLIISLKMNKQAHFIT